MSRPVKRGARSRLNLCVSAAIKARIERLRERTNAESLTEVVRRGLACYEALVEADEKGARILIEDPDTTIRELRMLL